MELGVTLWSVSGILVKSAGGCADFFAVVLTKRKVSGIMAFVSWRFVNNAVAIEETKHIMEENEMELHERIRWLLEKNGMSQADLARSIGVAETTISRYLSGKRRPKAPFLGKVAKLFGVSMYWLAFGQQDVAEGYSAVRNIVARNAVSLTDEQRLELMRIITEASVKLEAQK